MNKFTSFVQRLFENKKVLVVISIMLSFLIWYSFSQYYNPVSSRTIKDVPISFDTSQTAISSNGLEIVYRSHDTVEVVVTGKTANVMKLTAADITVTPSLSGITEAGDYTVPLNYSKSSILSDFDVSSISPKTVKIKVDSVNTRPFSVTAEAIGATAPDGLICESPVITDTANREISITGALTDIERISSVVARAKVNDELDQTTEFDADIILLDKNGKEISKDGLTLSFDTAKITISISKLKTVGINVVFSNAPIKPFCDYSVSVATVTIIGEPKMVDSLQKIDLLPIDYGKINANNNVFECELNPPTGVRVHDGLEKVKVTLDTSSVRSKTVKVSTLKFNNFDASLGTVKLNNSVNVTVCGSRTEINKITGADFTINVNLGSYDKQGEYTVPVTVTLNGEYDSVWVSTLDKEYTAYITISAKK